MCVYIPTKHLIKYFDCEDEILWVKLQKIKHQDGSCIRPEMFS